jgi:hypothetical protein
MRKFLFSVFVLLVTPSAFAFTGNDLLSRMVVIQIINEGRGDGSLRQTADSSFAQGFIAGIFFTLDDIDLKVCLPNPGGNVGQYVAVTKRYLENNPNQLHRLAHVLVREAAIQAFPCKR